MKRILISTILLLALIVTAYAAWTAVSNCDCGTTGQNLNETGPAGCGSGWNGDWTQSTGTLNAITAPAGGQGGLAIRGESGGGDYSRAITAISAGSVRCLMRASVTTVGDCSIKLSESGTGRMFVKFMSGGNIQIYNGNTSVYDTIQAYNANQWYTVDIAFDDAAQPNQYRARVDSGSWTAWKDVLGSTYTNISSLAVDLAPGGSETFFVDNILATPAAAAPAILFMRRRR